MVGLKKKKPSLVLCKGDRYLKKSPFLSTQYSSIPTFQSCGGPACGDAGYLYPDPEDQISPIA